MVTKTEFKEKAEFLNIRPDIYWYDLNQNGREETGETFQATSKEFKTKADDFIKSHPASFFDFIQWVPSSIKATREQYFAHPEKKALEQQVDQDIAHLNQMKDRPEIYSKLLEDLKTIKEELQYIKFRYPKSKDEVPEGFIGIYDPLTNTMIVTKGAPASLLIHELDHKLTAHRRTENWSVPLEMKCPRGHLHKIPKDSNVPSPQEARTVFAVSLDFPKSSSLRLTYDAVAYYAPLFASLKFGKPACTTFKSRDAVLANEVRGYLTMSRYLLMRMEVTSEEIQSIEKGGNIDFLSRLKTHLSDTNLNPRWANNLLLHYFGRGGKSGKENLVTFVEDYYKSFNDPGLVDQPKCIPI